VKNLLASAALALAGGALAVVVAGCGSEKAVSLGQPQPQTTTAKEQTGTVPTFLSLQVWFARNNGLVGVHRTHQPTQLVATAAVNALLDGPTSDERLTGLASAVPPGTKLIGIAIRNGVATVDLTSEFQSGAGSRSMQMRLAQVVYTLTQFPTVRGVRTARSIGDTKPLTRADFEDVTPAILVESPLPHERVASPLHVSGTANTFEATFVARLLDSAGRELARKVVTATSGSGMRGTYDAALTFPDTATPRWLEAYEPSAENGRPLHKVRIPVNG
jgi:Sporulation and spore germination/Immunoglobulin-like domain of bacterial spore germination